MSGVELQRRALRVMELALDQPDRGRRRWLEQTCGGDTEFYEAVDKLLRADAFAADLLPTQPREPTAYVALEPPERIGPYRLAGRLGEGGMGEVFLGQRDDGLFEQQVAVKLLRPSLFPTASEQFFDSERRLLASLKHPDIARILDGGVEPGGRPYFIMELVEGESIDRFAEAQSLSVREIGALAARLCRAVQTAHQALVIHADIKPSNVLVERDGSPKLLDFGIACLAEDDGESGPQTAFPVTPAYASPQRLTGARPSTQDDVFSLGALIRTLLAGATGAPGDLEAIVAKAMHPEPAQRYATAAALADDLDRWAAHQPVTARPQTTLYVLSRLIRRRRWLVTGLAATASALIVATGVITGLYLQAQEARADAEARFTDSRHMARYLLFDVYDRLAQTPQSLPVRHDVAQVGQRYMVSLSQDRRASTSVRLEAIEGLIRLADLQAGPERGLGDATGAHANLARAANLAAQLAQADPGRADVALAGARLHLAQATLALFIDNNAPAAERDLASADGEIRRAQGLAAGAADLAGVRLHWRVLTAQLRETQGDYRDAVARAREAVGSWEALTPSMQAAPESRRLAAAAYDALAEATYYAGDPARAVTPYRRQLQLLAPLLAEHPADPRLMHLVARADWSLGSTLVQLRQFPEGLSVLADGLRVGEAAQAFDASDATARRTVRSLRNMIGQALTGVGRHDEAIAMLRLALAERQAALQTTPGQAQAERDVAVGQISLGDAYLAAQRRPQSCAAYRGAQATFAAMTRHGALSAMDRDYEGHLLDEGVARSC